MRRFLVTLLFRPSPVDHVFFWFGGVTGHGSQKVVAER
jgi:hypothetical protein